MTNNKNCIGCSACYSGCPQKCIKMVQDREGFYYPKVNEDNCTHCGKCTNICPFTFTLKKQDISKSYIAQHKDQYIRKKSSSGGVFTEIARYVIEELNGIVFGAAFDSDWMVYHFGTVKIEDIKYFRGSKYVQSHLENCYNEIKGLLEDGRTVCFSGTPCQINGLIGFLGGKRQGLILVDVVCHGVSSPLVWKKYVSFYMEYADKTATRVDNIEFRNKSFGYFASTMSVEFSNGKIENNTNRVQFAKNAYFQGLSLHKSCYDCPFKKNKDRASDITLFDCWHYKELSSSEFDENGTTSVLVNSTYGEKLIKSIECNVNLIEVDREYLISLDGDMYYKSPKENIKRKEFFQDINLLSIPDMIKKYFPLTIRKSLIIIFRPILYKMGLISKIKELLWRLNIK